MNDMLPFGLFFMLIGVVLVVRPQWSHLGRWIAGPDGQLSPVDANLIRVGAAMGFAVGLALIIHSQFVPE